MSENKKPKWSPGPWEVGEYDHNDQPQVVSGYDLVAVCAHECLASRVSEALANAHLIAAAPDLYEALESMAEAWPGPSLSPTLATARAALAKARGETEEYKEGREG